ncbi:hypothetical protein ACLQ2R_03055 [Streptosporangium sp. DT93]|uniref:hypothetical protein n=1 Tax=Streptosporangium sp. DT93 TaxID=3393428 RepID=UPI003CF64FE7
MSTDDYEYAVERTPGHGKKRITRVLGSEAHAEEVARALRRVQLSLLPHRVPDAIVVRRLPGGPWELRPQDQPPSQASGRRRPPSACRARLLHLALRAARSRYQRAPRSGGQSAGPLSPVTPVTPAGGLVPEPDADPLAHAQEADAMVQALLDEMETHPDGPMRALVERLGHDDDQTAP